MQVSRITGFAVTVAVVVGSIWAMPVAKAAAKASPAEAALRAAGQRNRYSIVTFYKKNNAASARMLGDAKKLAAKHSARAGLVTVDVTSLSEKGLVSRYGVDRAPIPLTLVIAPNGAVTAGYPNQIKKMDLSDAFVSDGMASVLKVIQSGKLAAVCLQNAKTMHNAKSYAAATGLNRDPQFRGAVSVIKIDPADRSEAKFLQVCKVDSGSKDAQVVVIAAPGRVVGKFAGPVTTQSISTGLMTSLGGGCSGGSCGPGGCGPR